MCADEIEFLYYFHSSELPIFVFQPPMGVTDFQFLVEWGYCCISKTWEEFGVSSTEMQNVTEFLEERFPTTYGPTTIYIKLGFVLVSPSRID